MHTHTMSTRILITLGFSLATMHAADPAPADLLRQGLFEEEANQNLDKAAEHYRAVIAAHNRQRALAASATFRLGEIARKQNDTEAAAAAFRTVAERFPEQEELARFSRENLAALGIEPADPTSPGITDPEEAEIARLKELARNSPDLIDGADAKGWRPIHHAAAKGYTRVLSYLLENKVDPDGKTVSEMATPLHLAAIYGHLGAVNRLLAAKADPNLPFDIKLIFSSRFPPTRVKAPDVSGQWTALDLAILYNRRETAFALMEAVSDLQRKGPRGPFISGGFRGTNSLQLAIYFQRNDLAQAMIDATSSLATTREDVQITPLLAIAVIHNADMIAPLFKAGADVNARFVEGSTPLHWAPTAEVAELLLSKGADPNAKDRSGLTPLDYVAKRDEIGSNATLLDTLLKHGAKIPDPHDLLERTSTPMLPLVRERLIYPNAHRPDAILLSVDELRFIKSAPQPRQRIIRGNPALVAVEVRPSENSPPPSFAEVLGMGFKQVHYPPQSIRILRRDTDDRIEVVREWTPTPGTTVPTEWPTLEWGDIVEVRIPEHASSGMPTISDFAALIPDRNVTFRLGDLEIPRTISGGETFWLDRNSDKALRALIPEIEILVNPHHFAIHREGLTEPITLDFSEPTETKFRLLDGDTVGILADIVENEGEFRITVTQERLLAGGKSVAKEQLEEELKALAKDTRIMIISDRSVTFEKVGSIFELCSEAGLANVVFSVFGSDGDD